MVDEEVCSEMFLQQIREAESSYKNLMKSPNILPSQVRIVSDATITNTMERDQLYTEC